MAIEILRRGRVVGVIDDEQILVSGDTELADLLAEVPLIRLVEMPGGGMATTMTPVRPGDAGYARAALNFLMMADEYDLRPT